MKLSTEDKITVTVHKKELAQLEKTMEAQREKVREAQNVMNGMIRRQQRLTEEIVHILQKYDDDDAAQNGEKQ